MSPQNRQTPVWVIWALVLAFAVIEIAAWSVGRRCPATPARPRAGDCGVGGDADPGCAGNEAHRVDGGADSRAGAHASRKPGSDRAAADPERDAANRREVGRCAARLSGARGAHRAHRALRPGGPRASERGGRRVSDVHGARAGRGAARAAPGRTSCFASSAPCSAASCDRRSR